MIFIKTTAILILLIKSNALFCFSFGSRQVILAFSSFIFGHEIISFFSYKKNRDIDNIEVSKIERLL